MDRKATVLCAVRGGAQSQITIDRAVQVAQEREARLVLLYVVDAEFLGYATVGRLSVILRELRSTGEFMMVILERRIESQGVDVQSVVRTGDVRRQILESIRWQDADLLVIGHPIKSPGTNTFTAKSLSQFVEEIEEKTGVEVVVVKVDEAASESSAGA